MKHIKNRKNILIVANDGNYTYNLRREIIEDFIQNGYEVYVCVPSSDANNKLRTIGCKLIFVDFEGHGVNPIHELKLLLRYHSIVKKLKPQIILTFTIKPNLYLSFISKFKKYPVLPNITGLGTLAQKNHLLFTVKIMYKILFSRVSTIFVQNDENYTFLEKLKLKRSSLVLLPGSGVNLETFPILPYPNDNIMEFTFIGRVISEKGVYDLLNALKYLDSSNYLLNIVGPISEEVKDYIENTYNKDNKIIIHGHKTNLTEILQGTACLIHPSYHEGMANVILEASSSGRPSIVSNIAGCREIVNNNSSGMIFEAGNEIELAQKMNLFMSLDQNERLEMGLKARKKMEKEFDRNIVVTKYREIALQSR